MTIRENLIGEQFVKGNSRDYLQVYNIYYYPPAEGFPTSKVWLYFNRKDKEKYLYLKSLCFENIENHRNFILNNLFYHLYWLEKQAAQFKPEWMPIGEYRLKLMDAVLSDVRKKLLAKVKERVLEVRR